MIAQLIVNSSNFILLMHKCTIGANEVVEVSGSKFNLQFEDLLLFTTGVPAEPPMGFSPGL